MRRDRQGKPRECRNCVTSRVGKLVSCHEERRHRGGKKEETAPSTYIHARLCSIQDFLLALDKSRSGGWEEKDSAVQVYWVIVWFTGCGYVCERKDGEQLGLHFSAVQRTRIHAFVTYDERTSDLWLVRRPTCRLVFPVTSSFFSDGILCSVI